MDEQNRSEDDDRDEQDTGAPNDADAEQSDPESGPASAPPPGQEPGEGKTHDL